MDECGSNVGLAPLRTRAPKGERACGKAPRNRGKNMTLLASMGAEGMGPCMAVERGTSRSCRSCRPGVALYVGHIDSPVKVASGRLRRASLSSPAGPFRFAEPIETSVEGQDPTAGGGAQVYAHPG